MTSKYHSLQPLAFRTTPDADFFRSCWILRVPSHWKEILREMQGHLADRDPDSVTVPVISLHKALRALVPYLIAIEANAWGYGDKPWLYAARPIDTQALYFIVRAWANTVFARLPDTFRLERLEHLRASDLMWKEEVMDLAARKISANGTAEPQSPHAYHILPDLLAAKFCREGVHLETDGEPLRFRRAPLPTTPGTLSMSGSELVSWPPRRQKVGKKTALFSVVLNFSVQTVPFQEFPVVHCGIGRRRWVYEPRTSFPKGEDTSVYLLPSVPWLEGLEHSSAFQVAPMRWQFIPEEERVNDDKFRAAWADDFAGILEKLHLGHPFPSAEDIRQNPLEAVERANPASAIVFRAGMQPPHKVGVGVPPVDRRHLAQQIEVLLRPEMQPVEPLVRVPVTHKRTNNPFTPQDKASIAPQIQAERRQALEMGFRNDIGFEIWFQSTREREALRLALRSKLGMSQNDTFPFSLGSIQIHLDEQRINSLAAPLKLPHKRVKSAQVRTAIEKRGEEIAKRIQYAPRPTIALVQIGGPDSFEGRSDPKSAIRRAFARQGRLTQFLTTTADGEDGLAHRASSSVLDALRQMGLQLPFSTSGQPLHCVGLWLVKQPGASSGTGKSEYLPVLVRVDGCTGEILAIAGRMSSWQQYHEVLRQVGAGEVRGVPVLKDVAPLLRDLVQRDLLSGPDTLLLCHAQNTRSVWPWLANSKVTRDRLAFGNEPAEPLEEWPGLRIVRVRDNQRHETPEYYPLGEGDKTGFTQGLFRVGERVFMSLNPKPVQVQPNTNRSMLNPWKDSKDRVFGPSVTEYDRNQTLCELTLAGLQPGDEPEKWAALAHYLRSVATHYEETTSLPIALHLASQIKHYILPLDFEQ